MAIYRKEWTDPKHGWRFRFDIVPYDETLSGAVTTLSGAETILVELGSLTEQFPSELPIGLMAPPEMTVKVVLDSLPAALQTRLRTKISGTDRNLFLLFTDNGTNGATYTLRFAGCQAKIAGNTWSKEAGRYVTEIELVDALYTAMVSLPMSVIDGLSYAATEYGTLFDVLRPNGNTSAYHDSRDSATGWSDGYRVDSMENIMTKVRLKITEYFVANIGRTTNVGTVATQEAADYLGDMWDFCGETVDFYTASTSLPRVRGSALSSTTLLLVSQVTEAGTNRIVAGMTSTRDKYSWARYETAWDWYKDLCETMNAKATYYPVYNAGSGNPYISYAWTIAPPLADSLSAPSFDFTKIVEGFPDIEETADTIGKAEVRIETESGSDITQWIVNNGISRADKQFTLQCKLHNLPTYKPDYEENDGDSDRANMISKGLFQTNLLCYVDGVNIVKVHEDVSLYTDTAVSTTYTANDGVQNISEYPLQIGDDGNAQTNWQVWVNGVQRYGGLPYALAQHVIAMFGNDSIASFEATFRGIYDVIGRRCTITNSPSELSHLGWSCAIATKVETDYDALTTTIKFVMVP